LRPPARHQLYVLPGGFEMIKQRGDVGRIVLTITIEGSHAARPCGIDSGPERGTLATLAKVGDDIQLGNAAGEVAKDFAGVVVAGIVDVDDLETHPAPQG